MSVAAVPVDTEVHAVREDERDRLDTMRAQARELRTVLDHEGRLQTLEYAMVELRKADVDTRVETNAALREMSRQIGQLTITRWVLVAGLVVCSSALTTIAVVTALQFFAGMR